MKKMSIVTVDALLSIKELDEPLKTGHPDKNKFSIFPKVCSRHCCDTMSAYWQ